jgi:hypothetical protein
VHPVNQKKTGSAVARIRAQDTCQLTQGTEKKFSTILTGHGTQLHDRFIPLLLEDVPFEWQRMRATNSVLSGNLIM